MMKPLVVSMPGEMELAQTLASSIEGDLAESEVRSFPDGETYVRIESPVEGRQVVVATSLDRPNEKFLPLCFVAETVRELGARRVGLAAPYLAYMRQDGRFRGGEAVTSRYFGRFVSELFDWLVTVEPHLHRNAALDQLYAIPTRIVRAAGPIARWIEREVDDPVLVGPDEESEQWVSPVAQAGGFPTMILDKVRHGDYDVQVTGPDSPIEATGQPVILDDIISTGRTMLEAVRYLDELSLAPPICIGIHGLFVDDAMEILDREVADIVTCNTVCHPTNAIDIGDELAQVVTEVLERRRDHLEPPGRASAP